jgi:hypothetical protein
MPVNFSLSTGSTFEKIQQASILIVKVASQQWKEKGEGERYKKRDIYIRLFSLYPLTFLQH